MKTWICIVCGLIYDEAKGWPEEGIPAAPPLDGGAGRLAVPGLWGEQGGFRDARAGLTAQPSRQR